VGSKRPKAPDWVLHYVDGGPLDGLQKLSPDRVSQHVIGELTDGEGFVGAQVYHADEVDEARRIIVLRYSGERWGPKLA
jgi:hypothetical protein